MLRIGAIRVVTLLIVLSAVSLLAVFSAFELPAQVRLERLGVEDGGFQWVYMSKVYLDEEHVATIYVIIPKGSNRAVVSVSHVERVRIKNMELVFNPRPGVFIPIAWMPSTMTVPIKFYREGFAIIWRCEDLGFYGEATVTLEFFFSVDDPKALEGLTTSISFELEKGRHSYRVFDSFTITLNS